MKKALAFALALVLAASFAACGGAPGGEISSAVSASLPQSSSPAPPSAPSASVRTPPPSQSASASDTGNSQVLPDVPGVLPEVPHFEEQQGTLLAETDTERTYLIHTDIVIPDGDNPRPPRGFAYTITVPVPLYFEDGQYLFIPGHLKTTFSDEQPPLKLGDLAPVLFYPGNGTPEDHVFFDEVDEALGGELIEQGTMELDDGRTLYYCHYHVDHEGGPGEVYVAAVGLGGGFFPSFAFQMYDGYTPAEWWDLSVFTSILASVKPYDGE